MNTHSDQLKAAEAIGNMALVIGVAVMEAKARRTDAVVEWMRGMQNAILPGGLQAGRGPVGSCQCCCHSGVPNGIFPGQWWKPMWWRP